jgi:hypothetical protein
MEIPGTNSANPDPYMLKDGKVRMSIGSDLIPADRQIPKVAQFCLGVKDHVDELNKLFSKCFAKEVIIWNLDKNWSKEGDYMVAVFYSEILDKKESKDNREVVHTKSNDKTKYSYKKENKEEDTEQMLISFLASMKKLDAPFDDNREAIIEDDD